MWGSLSALLGYLAGDAWQKVETAQAWLGFAILGLIVVGVIRGFVRHRRTDLRRRAEHLDRHAKT